MRLNASCYLCLPSMKVEQNPSPEAAWGIDGRTGAGIWGPVQCLFFWFKLLSSGNCQAALALIAFVALSIHMPVETKKSQPENKSPDRQRRLCPLSNETKNLN